MANRGHSFQRLAEKNTRAAIGLFIRILGGFSRGLIFRFFHSFDGSVVIDDSTILRVRSLQQKRRIADQDLCIQYLPPSGSRIRCRGESLQDGIT